MGRMNIPDIINGLFEFGGAGALGLNVARIYRDKAVAGFHPGYVAFFTAWGIWNLYFYPHLGQWWSLAGGIALVAVNLVWLGQIYFYLRLRRHAK